MTQGHAYKLGRDGRNFRSRPGIGFATHVATLACSRCPAVGEVNYTTLPPPDQIDKKFVQRGWNARKRLCPNCISAAAAETKEKQMATTITPAAMKAQAKMFELLQSHFDTEAGAYAAGWSDAKVAAETNIGPDLVTAFRQACFGELKEPPEIASLRSDIQALAALETERHASVEQAIGEMRSRLARVSAKWGA